VALVIVFGVSGALTNGQEEGDGISSGGAEELGSVKESGI